MSNSVLISEKFTLISELSLSLKSYGGNRCFQGKSYFHFGGMKHWGTWSYELKVLRKKTDFTALWLPITFPEEQRWVPRSKRWNIKGHTPKGMKETQAESWMLTSPFTLSSSVLPPASPAFPSGHMQEKEATRSMHYKCFSTAGYFTNWIKICTLASCFSSHNHPGFFSFLQ